MRRPLSLRDLVRRTLPLQLFAATVVLAVVFASLALLREQQRVSDTVLEEARLRLEFATLRTARLKGEGGLSAAAAARQAVDEMRSVLPRMRSGEFTRLRIYDAAGTLLHDFVLSGADAGNVVDAPPASLHGSAVMPRIERVRIAGQAHLRILLPVTQQTGAEAAWAEGWLRLSGYALAQSRRHALNSMLGVAFVVAVTTLVLYPVVLRLTRRLARHSENLLEANLETLAVLGSAVAKRDSDTDAHNYRVTLYAVTLAEAAGLDGERMRGLIKGAFLHDVGKIGIRDHILHKPGRLDEAEFRIMRTHVEHGLDIIGRSAWLAPARHVVGGHHEKYDGSGYPAGLAGEAIALEARIFAIVDVFDALTSARPYKAAFSLEDTLRILGEGRGSHFDPQLLDVFSAIAPDLHARYGGRDDAQLRAEARDLVRRFFAGGLDTLEA